MKKGAWWLGMAMIGAALTSCTHANGTPPLAPRPPPRAANEKCAACHAEITAEWRASLHRAAHDAPSYREALAGEPVAFCESCHAPEGRDVERASLGVACTTCHGEAPHDGAASASTRCAQCHQFAFPGRDPHGARDLMQLTFSEHARSAYSEVPCTGCHMQRTGGHASHVFSVSRDPAMIRRALDVRARFVGATTLEVRLAPAWVGHAVPTGDLFRRLVVGADALNAGGEPIAHAMQTVGRTFGRAHGSKAEIADNRPGAPGPTEEETVLTLDLGEPADRARVWIDYQRVLLAKGDRVDVQESTRIADLTLSRIGTSP